MRIAYVNANYKQDHTGGGFVHKGQFVKHATSLGHEIWSYSNAEFPEAKRIPTNRFDHISTLRNMDVFYLRLESRFPEICRWSLPPRRTLYGFPLVVWEFNTIPEDAEFLGDSKKAIQQVIHLLQHYGKGCDLAICVACSAAEYVQKTIGIDRTLVIPNGSDPDQFNPELPPVKRMEPFRQGFNVAWIGSARLKYHDFETIKSAAQILWDNEKHRNIYFHIIGPDLNNIMAEMTPNVFYWGAEDYKIIPHWLSAMDAGLYITIAGSSAYGSPLKVMDYLASALPVISTEHPANRNLFTELGWEELLIPTEDSGALAETILQLYMNQTRTKRLGRAGRNIIIEKYNWRRAVQDTMKELNSLLKEKGRTQKD